MVVTKKEYEQYLSERKTHFINEMWKEKEGSKTVWKLQAPKGILTCRTKKEALAWKEAYLNSLKKEDEI